MRRPTAFAVLSAILMITSAGAQAPARNGIVLDVEYHYPDGAKPAGQVTVQTMQPILEILRPLETGVWKPRRDVWFQKHHDFTIAIPAAYFAREAAILKDSPFDEAKRTREVLLGIAERRSLDGALPTGDADLDAILKRRGSIAVYDKSEHSGFLSVKVDYTQKSRGGYTIVGGPATGVSQSAVGLDAQITITRQSKQVFQQKLPCQWGGKLGYVFTPAENAKKETAHRILDVLAELLPRPDQSPAAKQRETGTTEGGGQTPVVGARS